MTARKLARKAFHDHAELGELARRLRAALVAEDGGLMKSLLIDLEVVEARHYALEDELMRAVAYPAAAEHRGEHLTLLDVLRSINQTLMLENLRSVAPQVVAHIEAALMHMVDADGRLHAFVSSVESGNHLP